MCGRVGVVVSVRGCECICARFFLTALECVWMFTCACVYEYLCLCLSVYVSVINICIASSHKWIKFWFFSLTSFEKVVIGRFRKNLLDTLGVEKKWLPALLQPHFRNQNT